MGFANPLNEIDKTISTIKIVLFKVCKLEAN